MDNATLLLEVERLKAENIALKNRKATVRKLTCRVSSKGGVSVYGLGRFPVTLYKSQWDRLLSATDEIKQFIVDNTSLLVTKD